MDRKSGGPARRGGKCASGDGIDAARLADLLAAHHAAQIALCEELEAIADCLPERTDAAACLAAAGATRDRLVAAHGFEEAGLWPALRRIADGDARLEASLERLRGEHREDESYGEEVAAELTAWGTGAGPRNAEAIGYMLRGFFEGVRRHVVFEKALIAPLLAQPPAEGPGSTP